MSSKLEKLLTTEMTRRQFLATIGLAVVSLFGLSSIMGLLSGNDSDSNSGAKRPDYGMMNYGP